MMEKHFGYHGQHTNKSDIIINIKPPGFKLFRALIYMPSIIPLTAAGTIAVNIGIKNCSR